MNCDYILPGNPLEHSRATSLTIYPVRCCYSICVACCASDFRKYVCLFILIYNLREFLHIEYQSRGSAHCHIIEWKNTTEYVTYITSLPDAQISYDASMVD